MLFEPPVTAESGERAATVLTVSELNRIARRALESQLPLLWVEGEISNFTAASSGHWYFSLKDANAQVRCVMFRTRNLVVDFAPANGDHVEIRALPSLYEARGEFQLGVENIRRAGAGRLYEALLKLKARLAAEGLFDSAKKRALPGFIRCVGVITSPQAAALNDVLTALMRRMPGLTVVLYPTPVQGQQAGAQIAAAIQLACQRAECDVLLVCRGGGSLEDLWAFNDEAVVRAIAASRIPIVSGVGHETDLTLTDFVADVRGPTPTAAAELVSPLRAELLQTLQRQHVRLTRSITRALDTHTQHIDQLARLMVHPAEALRRQHTQLGQLQQRLNRAIQQLHERRLGQLRLHESRMPRLAATLGRQQQRLNQLQQRLQRAPAHQLGQHRLRLDRLGSNLAHLNPLNILARGYSVVSRPNGEIVRDASSLSDRETVNMRFHRGSATSEVKTVSEE